MVRPRFVDVEAMADTLRRLPELPRDYAYTELVIADYGIGTMSSTFPQIRDAYLTFTGLVPRRPPSEAQWSKILPAAAALLVELDRLNLFESVLRLCDGKREWGPCDTAINPVTGKCPFVDRHI